VPTPLLLDSRGNPLPQRPPDERPPRILRSPERRHFRDLPILGRSAFQDVQAVTSTIAELDRGQFNRAAQLAESMIADDRIEGVIQTRVDALFSLPLELSQNGDGRKAPSVVDDAQDGWERRFPQAELKKLLRWALYLKVVPYELIWSLDGDRWDFRIKVWDPRWMWFDFTTRTYRISTLDGTVELTPGDGHWGLYAPMGANRGWIYGLLRPLALLFLMRQWAFRDWARYSEVHGLPIKKAIVPSEGTPNDVEEFKTSIASLGSEGLVTLSQSADAKFDLDLLEAKANTWEGFQRLIERCDESIAVAALGQNLTTAAKAGGSYALGNVHDRIRLDRLEADAKSLGPCLYEQCLRPWALYNYGDENLAPTCSWSTKAPMDRAANAKTFLDLGGALEKLRNSGLNVDLVQVAQQFNIPLVEGKPLIPVAKPEKPGATKQKGEEPESKDDSKEAAEEPPKRKKKRKKTDDADAESEES
jgi:hypothetical protein